MTVYACLLIFLYYFCVMHTKAILLCLLAISIKTTCAFEPGLSYGSRAIAMGNCGMFIQDPFSAINNPALLSKTQSSIGISVQNRFGINDLNAGVISGIIQKNSRGIGFFGSSFGNNLFNSHRAGLSFATQLQANLHAGISLFYQGNYTEGYGNMGQVGFTINMVTALNKHTNIALKLMDPWLFSKDQNAIQQQLSQGSIAIGLSHHTSSQSKLFIESEVFQIFPTDLRVGFVYGTHQAYSLMGGFSLLRQSVSIGISKQQGIPFSCAFTLHNRLGFSPTFDLYSKHNPYE